MGRVRVLDAARDAVLNARNLSYGEPEDCFGAIAKFWTTYLGREVTCKDVAVMMILLKVARIKTGGGSFDNPVDIAGYAACLGEFL